MPQNNKQEPPTREIVTARKTITEQERGLALTAVNQFKSRHFDASLEQLKKLSELRQHDTRVMFNKAVVEYYISKLSKTDDFQKLLTTAKKQLVSMVNTGDELDDIDRSFLLYNEAILLFHVKQYKGSINILERLFKIIEPLDDLLAAKVCTLLVEVYLLNYQLEEAYGMISYVESVLLASKFNSSGYENDEENKKFTQTYQTRIQMLKIRLLMARGFYNQSKKELNLTVKSVEGIFMKANVEWVRGDHREALKLLNNAPKNSNHLENGQPLVPMFYNNMACIHFTMKKYTLAVLYAKKAFNENQSIMKSLPPIEKGNPHSGRPLYTLAINRRTELLYNIGISLLFADQPIPAFDCFMEAQSRCQCNPRFWLRLAECCIAVAQQTRNNLESCVGKKNEYIRGVTGSGHHRKIVLSPFHHHLPQTRHPGQSAAMPGPTLEFANLCLSNAMLLMPSGETLENAMTTFLQNEHVIPGDDDNEPVKRSFLGRIFVDVPPGDPIQTKEAYHLRSSILCCQAFISLGICDYQKTLEYTNELLQMKHILSHQKFLAHMYRTEAFIKLDRINEAVQQLSPETLKSMSTLGQDVKDLKTGKPFPRNILEARAFIILNVVNISCIRGEYEKSKLLLRQVVSTEYPSSIRSHAVLLSIYCDLQLGRSKEALTLIKRNEVFPSGRLIDRVDAARAMQQLTPQAYLPQMQQGLQTPIGMPPGNSNISAGTQAPTETQQHPPSRVSPQTTSHNMQQFTSDDSLGISSLNPDVINRLTPTTTFCPIGFPKVLN